MQVVLIATHWGTAEGGINAFNQPFAKALAKVGTGRLRVACAVETATNEDVADARANDVLLVAVDEAALAGDGMTGELVAAALAKANFTSEVTIWVGHDVKTGFAATSAAERLGGRAALVHHMDYGSYRNLWGGRGQDTAARTDEQIRLFSSPGAILFGVGDDLRESAATLGAGTAHRIVPGFPEGDSSNVSSRTQLAVIVAGRFDAGSEPLKQSRLVAAGLGRAVRLAGGQLRALARPKLTVLGATAATIARAELEEVARREADRVVNVVPAGFDAEKGILRHLRRANLAVMPSVREGFGLFGCEAIGCDVPLILGDQTGLASLLDGELDNHADRHVTKLELTGGNLDERDIAVTAEAIVRVAQDLEHAKAKAFELRHLLKDRLGGCTWHIAAERFLHACGLNDPRAPSVAPVPPAATVPSPRPQMPEFDVEVENHRVRCAELELDDRLAQGSTDRRFDVFATLRFGKMELADGDLEISVGIKRALVRLTTDHGRLAGERLGEGADAPPGIVASAGGIWELTDPDGGILRSKILGDEPLCRIETPANLPAHAKVKVTAARRDIVCEFGREQPLKSATEGVMRIFLENALFEKESAHLVLSVAEMRKQP